MARPLTLYTHPHSRGRIARWMIEETGLPYEAQILEYGTTMKAPAYLALNRMGKVPTLVDGDVVVTEVAAICMHLADLVPEKKLAPPVGSAERGAYYRWIVFMTNTLEALLTAKHAGALAPTMNAGYGNEADVLDTLSDAVRGRTHLVGDHFTAADLFVAAFLDFYIRYKMIEPRPEFVAFAAQHTGRPACVRANAIDDALVAAAAPAPPAA